MYISQAPFARTRRNLKEAHGNSPNTADEGGHLPPKSTWVEPKLRSGLFVYEFGNHDHHEYKPYGQR